MQRRRGGDQRAAHRNRPHHVGLRFDGGGALCAFGQHLERTNRAGEIRQRHQEAAVGGAAAGAIFGFDKGVDDNAVPAQFLDGQVKMGGKRYHLHNRGEGFSLHQLINPGTIAGAAAPTSTGFCQSVLATNTT